MIEVLKEVGNAMSLLLIPVWIAVAVCFIRGVKAEIRERKERRSYGPQNI